MTTQKAKKKPAPKKKTALKTSKKRNYPATRKTASDSKTSALEVMEKAAAVIEVPAHMTLCEVSEIYFRDIINERANADWSNHDVAVAAKLARMMAREDELDELLSAEGPTVTTEKGSIVKNPTATVLASTQGSIASFRRQLCLHAQAGNASSAVIGASRGQRKSIQDSATTLGSDPLLA